MHRGWFAVHRKIFDSDVWQHPTARVVWIYILGSVTHEEVTLSESYQAVTLQPAQMLTSVARIAAKCCLSTRSVRTALTYLISTNRMTIRTTSRFSIITVTNFGPYRAAMSGSDKLNDKPNDNQTTSRRQTDDNIQEDLNKTEKKKKDLPLALAPSGGAADHTQEHPQDEPDNSPEARAERKRQVEEMKKTHGVTTDKGNGRDHGVGEGKTQLETFTESLQDPEKKAFLGAYNRVKVGGSDPEVELIRLQNDGLSEAMLDQVEPFLKAGGER